MEGIKMTITVKVEVLQNLEEQIRSLQSQLKSLRLEMDGFETLESDPFLMEVYNG
jgi:prefoldin subunit 5